MINLISTWIYLMCKNGRLKKNGKQTLKTAESKLKNPWILLQCTSVPVNMGMCPRSKSQGGCAIKKPVNITTMFFSTREYGNVPAIKIHGGGCYWKTREYGNKRVKSSFWSHPPKNTREYWKKGQNRFLEDTFWETPPNFRKYNWILFTKFSCLQFLNGLSEKQI